MAEKELNLDDFKPEEQRYLYDLYEDLTTAWEEGDYDEAILQGIGSVSGGLQAAGAGMMLTGVGAPIGAVMFGLGSAGSLIILLISPVLES